MRFRFARRKSGAGYRSKPGKRADSKPGPAKTAWIGYGLTLTGILIPASIALATWKINDANFRAGMLNNFYARAQGEEVFWKTLYDDYLTTFAGEAASQGDLLRARLVAIMDFQRSRQIPTFREFLPYGVEEGLINAEVDRLKAIRDSLCIGLRDRASADPALQLQFEQRTFDCAPRQHLEPPVASAQSQTSPPAVQVAITSPVALDSNLRAPPSDEPEQRSPPADTGWDLDIFWCRGPAADRNYQRARMLGDEFGRLATAGRAIAAGVRLGRVRIRPVRARPNDPNSPTRASWVVADAGVGEPEAAAAVQGSANALLGESLIGAATSGGSPTRWYLSLFVCSGPEQR